MDAHFKGKHALVTGAGKGLGREIVKALWSSGAVTFALSRTQTDLDSLQEECPGIRTVCLDLAKDWEKTKSTINDIGHLDILVNNAGIFRMRKLMEITEEDYDYVFSTNVKSVLNVSQVVAQTMVERGQGGAIVNISSTLAKYAEPGKTLYCASKGALDQITRCLAVELGPHKIRVNSINPTIVLGTQMSENAVEPLIPPRLVALRERTPQKRFCTIQEVVNATLFVLSDKAEMVHGASLLVDGGLLCT